MLTNEEQAEIFLWVARRTNYLDFMLRCTQEHKWPKCNFTPLRFCLVLAILLDDRRAIKDIYLTCFNYAEADKKNTLEAIDRICKVPETDNFIEMHKFDYLIQILDPQFDIVKLPQIKEEFLLHKSKVELMARVHYDIQKTLHDHKTKSTTKHVTFLKSLQKTLLELNTTFASIHTYEVAITAAILFNDTALIEMLFRYFNQLNWPLDLATKQHKIIYNLRTMVASYKKPVTFDEVQYVFTNFEPLLHEEMPLKKLTLLLSKHSLYRNELYSIKIVCDKLYDWRKSVSNNAN